MGEGGGFERIIEGNVSNTMVGVGWTAHGFFQRDWSGSCSVCLIYTHAVCWAKLRSKIHIFELMGPKNEFALFLVVAHLRLLTRLVSYVL